MVGWDILRFEDHKSSKLHTLDVKHLFTEMWNLLSQDMVMATAVDDLHYGEDIHQGILAFRIQCFHWVVQTATKYPMQET